GCGASTPGARGAALGGPGAGGRAGRFGHGFGAAGRRPRRGRWRQPAACTGGPSVSRRAASGPPPWVGLALLALLVIGAAAFLLLRQPTAPAVAPAPAPVGSPQPIAEGGLWEVAFTTPLIPDDPARHHGGLDERLVALIERATRTLDVADYDFDLADVSHAMARAAGRGV